MPDTRVIKPEDNKGGTFTAQLTIAETTTAYVSPVPAEAPGMITAEPGTVNEECIYFKSKDAGAGTISGLTRDFTNLNGGVGIQHENGEDWEVFQSARYITNIIDALIEGYVREQQTVTYVDADEFTVLGNVAVLYTAGRILRINQDGTKICVVLSSSYSSGTGLTTVVIEGITLPDPITAVELAIQPKGLTQIKEIVTGIDAQADDDYEITPSPAITAYTTGLLVLFKANTANTGAATLNVSGLGTKTIKKLHDQDLETGDIEAGQWVKVVYDGTNFQMVSQLAQVPATISKATGAELDTGTDDTKFATAKALVDSKLTSGWTPGRVTWVYATASTFTIAGVDLTAVYTKGTRLRFKQGGAYKYATVITSVFGTDTTVTIAVNNDYTIANASITDNDYSYQENPQGYPEWFAFTPTWAGFSVNPSGVSTRYSIKGRMITYELFAGVGTSNSTSFTITLPVALASYYTGQFMGNVKIGVDAGTNILVYVTFGSTTRLDLYKTLALGGWTNSGNKGIWLQETFEMG